MKPAIVVYGPQGCGKTRNAELLRRHYGATRVVDDWLPGDAVAEGALLLTSVPGVPGAIGFAEAVGAALAAQKPSASQAA